MEAHKVLIVGGGSGIGEKVTEIVIRYSTAQVVVFGLHISEEVAALEKTESGRLWTVKGNITSPADRQKALAVCIEKMGGIDSLVISAGVMGEIQRIADQTSIGLRSDFEINFFGPMEMTQLIIPELRKTKGRILIFSSSCDKNVHYAGWMHYCASKAALTRAIEILAWEERSLHVLGIYPGLTRSGMSPNLVEGKHAGVMYDEEIQKFQNWDKTDGFEPPEWCATAAGKLALGLEAGGKSGTVAFYHELVPDCKDGFK